MFNRLARLLPLLLLCRVLAVSLQAEDQFFNSAGVNIHYIVEGKGEPVILIHGYAADIDTNWGQPGIIRGLSGDYKVIAIDIRGHGQSDKPHDAAAYGSRMVDDVIRLMDHLGIGKAHIAGYSMGGIITEALMADHPDRLLTAAIGGAGWRDPHDRGEEQLMNQLADSLKQGKGIGPLIVALSPPGAPPLTPQTIEMINQRFLASNDPLALAAVARAQLPPVKEAGIRGSRIPVLALIGEADPLKADVDRFTGMLPNLKIVVIPGANHLNAFGDPLFLSSLKSFLAEHSR
jgi:pimeloyl-ACP methyl ester carboxylesterase